MPDFVFNPALGRVTQLADNVELNSPAGSLLEMHAWVSSAADDLSNNEANVAGLEAVAGVAEATPYTQQSWAAADLTITVNNTTNLVDIDSTDVVFTAVAAQTAWSDVTVSYDSGGASTDANTLLLTNHDFIVTPNGGDITAQFAAAGWFQAT